MPDNPRLPDPVHIPDKQATLGGWRLAQLVLFTGLTALSIDLYLPAFPAIAADLGASPGEVQRTLSAYLLGVAVGQLFAGPLSDQVGRRPVLLGGFGLYALASLACVFVETAQQLVWLRLVQALGGCVAPVVVRGYIRDVASGHYAARALSTLMATTLVVPLLAPAAGGLIVEHFHWRGAFVVLTIASSASFAIAWFTFPETHAAPGGPIRWRELVLLAGFGQVLRDRTAQRYVGATMLGSGALFAYLAAAPFVFISWFGVPADRFFIVFGLNVIGIAAGGLLSARVVARYGSVRLFDRALVVQWLAAVALVAAAWLAPHSLTAYGVALLCFLACIQVIGTNASARTLDRFPHAAGTAAALAGTAQFLVGALVSAGVGHLPLPAPQGLALTVFASVTAGAAWAWRLRAAS